MKISNTVLNDCVVIEPDVYHDNRGFFLETYHAERYSKISNMNLTFVQDNCSRSKLGTLRGLHFQKTKPQGKLIRVMRGNILDVAVDLRKNSSTYAKYITIELSDQNQKQLWVPPGFAHGFLVLSLEADVEYKCTTFYDPDDEGSIIWNDPTLNITWPTETAISISPKDLDAGTFLDYDRS
mgnify:CR=1 FL=1|tara:strand:- start:6151 stop:6693 length:543 start_codon:yes stop_codon:yes gene_type:complete